MAWRAPTLRASAARLVERTRQESWLTRDPRRLPAALSRRRETHGGERRTWAGRALTVGGRVVRFGAQAWGHVGAAGHQAGCNIG
jgi:hypothetical protein